MKKLDDLVTTHLVERLFHPERLTAILASVSARRAEKAIEVDRRVSNLQTEVSGEVVHTLGHIKQSIQSVSEYITATAAAVEEQSVVTNETSSNMQRAAAEAAAMVT